MDGSIDFARPPVLGSAEEAAASRPPTRARLAAVIEELAAANAELAAAQEPATRLAAVIAEASQLKAELVALRANDEQRLGSWLAGSGHDPRPEPDPMTIAVETRLTVAASDAAAAGAALPAAEQQFQQCAERVRELQRRRDEAAYAVTIDAAAGFARDYGAALTAALQHEAVLHGLREALLQQGNRADASPGALEAAARVGELIAKTKRATAVHPRLGPGRQLLAALADDADANLQEDFAP